MILHSSGLVWKDIYEEVKTPKGGFYHLDIKIPNLKDCLQNFKLVIISESAF